jgi:hypothetical protein
MANVNLSLEADLGYADVPVPNKIFVPIDAGKFGPISSTPILWRLKDWLFSMPALTASK